MKIILGLQSQSRKKILEFVERIEGESESIMGLPVALTRRLIQEVSEV